MGNDKYAVSCCGSAGNSLVVISQIKCQSSQLSSAPSKAAAPLRQGLWPGKDLPPQTGMISTAVEAAAAGGCPTIEALL